MHACKADVPGKDSSMQHLDVIIPAVMASSNCCKLSDGDTMRIACINVWWPAHL